MIKSLKQLVNQIDSMTYYGSDIPIEHVAIHSKDVQINSLFVAIVGQRDGHEFVDQAIAHGAAAILVNRYNPDWPVSQIVCDDTTQGLQQLAQKRREQFTMPIAALTGSCGKTTVKTMVVDLLGEFGHVFCSPGNYNNLLGVPITLLCAPKDCDYLVIEAGTNSPGEIAQLADLIQPDVALITNIGAAHLEKLKTLQGVMQEKSALLKALGPQGVAIINDDDPYIRAFATDLSCHQYHVSQTQKQADFFQSCVNNNINSNDWQITLPDQRQITYTLPLQGQHQAMNSLLAFAMAYAMVGERILTTAAQTFAQMQPYQGRFVPIKLNAHITLIDDSYNASVLSVQAALAFLQHQNTHRIFVMSDMGELGQQAIHYHHHVGQLMKSSCDQAFLYGQSNLIQAMAEPAAPQQVGCFDDQNQLIDRLMQSIHAHANQPMTIVIKGARSRHMDQVVAALKTTFSTR